MATAPLGDLVLKGFPVPVAAWKVVAGEVAASTCRRSWSAGRRRRAPRTSSAPTTEWFSATTAWPRACGRRRASSTWQALLEAPAARCTSPSWPACRSCGDAGVVLDDRPAARISARIEALSRARGGRGVGRPRPRRAGRGRDRLHPRELATAFGLGGRARKAADTGERARKAVTNRIKDAIAKIEAVHPTLGRHLADSCGRARLRLRARAPDRVAGVTPPALSRWGIRSLDGVTGQFAGQPCTAGALRRRVRRFRVRDHSRRHGVIRSRTGPRYQPEPLAFLVGLSVLILGRGAVGAAHPVWWAHVFVFSGVLAIVLAVSRSARPHTWRR